ncbi:trypsin-like serine peptidase [Pseudonocardia alni]|uniref:trypsin-like serine peptidase n=1 Tax=Pseudonocardia alni TaxID=33907 RepID=UPI0027A1BEDB|nr:serine protease [Pseudonocardia alni]
MSTSTYPSAAETVDVVESSPDLESGTLSDDQKHAPVTGGGESTGTGESTWAAEGAGESDAGGGVGETDVFESGIVWEPPMESADPEAGVVDAAFAETDDEEFLQFLAPLVGPLLGTVLPAAAKALAGSVAPPLLQRLVTMFGTRPAPRPAVRRRESGGLLLPGAYGEADGSFVSGSEAFLDGGESDGESMLDEAALAEAISQLETVIGRDDRTRVLNTRAVPYKRICHLLITAPDGKRYSGTGWFIGPRTIATAGHCVYLHGAGGWAREIVVTPGRDGENRPYGTMTATRFSSVAGWTQGRSRDHDYGVIHLPRSFPAMDIGHFGFAAFNDARLRGTRLNLAGYPGDKETGTCWQHGQQPRALTPTRIVYTADTSGGMSGCPVFVTTADGRRYAVGIHTTGSLRGNSATRINRAVFTNLKNWSQG